MIRFSHSIFALPFGLMTVVLSKRGLPPYDVILWVIVAMVGARTAAMAFNRFADRRIDAANPRTRTREIPSGKVSLVEVWILITAGCAMFVSACAFLNPVALAFSPLVLFVLLGYSFTKRFTAACHFFLGLALGLSPMGAWVAVRGTDYLSQWWIPSILGLAVLVWTAGFDIIYACQDYEHDSKSKLRSLPKKLGLRRALQLSALLHCITLGLLLVLYFVADLSGFYLVGVALTGGLLLFEHRLVKPHDLSKVNAAFFTMNGLVSLVLLLATVLDVLVIGGPE